MGEDRPIFELGAVEVEEEGGEVALHIKGPESVVHALRRVMMDHVPVLAVADALYEECDCDMLPALVTDRLGLVPLKLDTPPGTLLTDFMNSFEDCPSCAAAFESTGAGVGAGAGSEGGTTTTSQSVAGFLGCERCSRILTLDVKNFDPFPLWVTTASLVVRHCATGPRLIIAHEPTFAEGCVAAEAISTCTTVLTDQMTEGAGAGIPLFKLGPGKGVKAVFRAQLGTNADHARWSAASGYDLRQRADIRVCEREVAIMKPKHFKGLLEVLEGVVQEGVLPDGRRTLVPVKGGDWNVEAPTVLREVLKEYRRKPKDGPPPMGVSTDEEPQLPVQVEPLAEFRLAAECTGAIAPLDLAMAAVCTLQRQTLALCDSMLQYLNNWEEAIVGDKGSMYTQ